MNITKDTAVFLKFETTVYKACHLSAFVDTVRGIIISIQLCEVAVCNCGLDCTIMRGRRRRFIKVLLIELLYWITVDHTGVPNEVAAHVCMDIIFGDTHFVC